MLEDRRQLLGLSNACNRLASGVSSVKARVLNGKGPESALSDLTWQKALETLKFLILANRRFGSFIVELLWPINS